MNEVDILEIIENLIEREKTSSCNGCKYWNREEWEEPCKRCKRNCKDYWTMKEGDKRE